MGEGLLFDEKGRKMALNIPVNLMNAAVPQIQSIGSQDALTITAIQPSAGSKGARGASSDGGGMNRGSSAQQALLFPQRTTQAPDRATPKSVVTAQTQSSGQEPTGVTTNGASPKILTPETPPQSELDRYAPPNPLPTAPILQFAASYAALTAQDT